MSLYYRLKRRLGYDTTIDLEHSQPIREYTVTHLNGETSTVRAHGYKIDGSFAKFYREDTAHVWCGMSYSVWSGSKKHVRTLEGIQEIESEVVQATSYHAVVDQADGSVVKREVVNPVGEA